MCELIAIPALQIVSVCDPNKMSTDYIDWSLNGIRDGIRKVLQNPTWGSAISGIPGGRDIGKEDVFWCMIDLTIILFNVKYRRLFIP